MRSVLFATIIVTGSFFTAPAHAQTPRVLAGEHGAFSRIVVPPAPDAGDIGEPVANKTSDDALTITIPTPHNKLNVRALTRAKKAHRVANASITSNAGGAELVLTLNCACTFAYTRRSDGALIIDISNTAQQPDLSTVTEAAPTPLENDVGAEDTTIVAINPQAETNQDAAANPVVVAPPDADADADAKDKGANDALSGPIVLAPPASPSAKPAVPKANQKTAAASDTTSEPRERPARNEEDRRKNIAAARERLISLLADANANGAINLTTAPSAAPTQTGATAAQNATASADDAAARATFGDSAPDSVNDAASPLPTLNHCPQNALLDGLKFNAEPVSFNDAVALRRLMPTLSPAEAGRAQIELIRIHVLLGLFDEAISIADAYLKSAQNGVLSDDIAFLAAMARLSGALSSQTIHAGDLAALFSNVATCAPLVTALNTAARAINGDDGAFDHAALAPLVELAPALSGPIHAQLALNALNRKDKPSVAAFTEHAADAFGANPPPTIDYLRTAMAALTGEAGHEDTLRVYATIQSPLQSQALADSIDVSKDAERPLDAAILNEIADHAKDANNTPASRRLANSGAQALAQNQRIEDAIALLDAAASAAPESSNDFAASAIALLRENILSDNPTTQLEAASSFFTRRNDLAQAAPDLIEATANIAAKFGLPNAVRSLYDPESPILTPGQATTIVTAQMNAGDAPGAYATAMRFTKDPALAHLGLQALRHSATTGIGGESDAPANDKSADTSLLRAALQRAVDRRVSSPEIATEAVYAKDWNVAERLFELIAPNALDAQSAKAYALSAYMNGAQSAPVAALKATANDDALNKTLAHIFQSAPPLNPQRLESLAAFADGVTQETRFIREEISR